MLIPKFSDYIHEQWFGGFCKSILAYCHGSSTVKSDLLDDYPSAKSVYVRAVDEITFHGVFIHKSYGTRIKVDIAAEANLDLIIKSRDDVDDGSKRIWVHLSCAGDLADGLASMFISPTEEYSSDSVDKTNDLLDDFMVPVISHERYDAIASKILRKYMPEVLGEPKKVIPETLAARIGTIVYHKAITKDASVFGETFFEDTDASFFDRKTGKESKESVMGGTIVIDDEAAYDYAWNCQNITLAHECVHAELHKDAFLYSRIFIKNLSAIKCGKDGSIVSQSMSDSTDFMESQANGIAPCLLMPKDAFLQEYEKLLVHFKESMPSFDELDDLYLVIEDLAEFFGVTKYAVRKRLIDLGHDEAVGTLNYVDGHYIKGYRFKPGSLKRGESFSVRYEDLDGHFLDHGVRDAFLNGVFAFADNHLCLNSPKYIEAKGEDGQIGLTRYAREHADECCVKFSIAPKKHHSRWGFSSFCYLCRDIGTSFDYCASLSEAEKLLDTPQAKAVQTLRGIEISDMKPAMSMSRGDAVDFLMKYRKISCLDAEVKSGISEKTFRRFRTDPNFKPKPDNVIILCLLLHLPMMMSNFICSRFGVSFSPDNNRDNLLLDILATMSYGTIAQANDRLRKNGFEPLS